MTLAPRFLINFWAGFRVARFVRRLKSLGRGVAAQEKIFASRMAQFTKTEFGREHGLNAHTSYAQFRESVPPRTYDYFQPLIRRMAAGEAGVLTSERCSFFVETAGTTGDRPQLLPVPEAMLKHYRNGLRDTLFLYAARVGHNGVFFGRHLHTGASTALIEENGTYRTSLDGILALSLTPWVEANLYSPPRALSDLPQGPEKIQATARCMVGRDVTLVAGTPAAVYALSAAAREAASTGKRRMTTLQAMWPNLECFLHSGAPLGLYSEVMRGTLGPTVSFHEVYSAAEGIIAAQDEGNSSGLRLLTDTGLFFEFLPLRDFHEETLLNAGALCQPLDKIEPGIDYVLLLTTPGGLCRYVTGDIVRFLSVNPPRLQFEGRTQLRLNSFGENVTERELFETLLVVCQQNGWQPVSFHVAPYHHRAAAGRTISSHEWWLEFRTHTMKTPTANVIAPGLDAELGRRNRDYAAKRANHTLEPPVIRLVVPGLFEQWTQSQNKISSLSKMPSCRSDRLIADQLARFTRFHEVLPENFTAPDPNATMPRRQTPDTIG
jgi:GH3 auxin-responsive promoter